MKSIRLPKSFLAALAASALLAMTLPSNLSAQQQSQTETKIKLMADALRARDNGDLAAAKTNLEQLRKLAPDDVTVQRLLANVNASLSQGGTPASGTAPTAKAPATASAPVPAIAEVSYPPKKNAQGELVLPPAAAAAAVPSAPLDPASELALAEETRIQELVKSTETQRKLARAQAKGKDYDDAIDTINETIQTLPYNTLTASTVDQLEKEKGTFYLEKSQYLLKQGDLDGSRAALEAYANASLASAEARKKQAKQAAKIANAEADPENFPIEKVSPQFVAEQKDIQKLVVKGRAQYLAGDVEGALDTFRRVETLSSSDPTAKYFLKRIAQEKALAGRQNREKTNAQALEEIANAWQRPGLYHERPVTDGAAAPSLNVLREKLDRIIMPSVDLRNMPLSQVVSTISALAEEEDKTPISAASPRVNIVLLDQSNTNPPVNISVRGMPLRRVLDLVVESVGYRYEVTDVVTIKPGGSSSSMLEMEIFPINKATILRMTGVGSSSASTPAAANADPFAAGGGGGGGGGSAGGEADAIRRFLQSAGVDFDGTQRASLAYDGAAIFVTQTTANLERVRNILARYNDVRQVEIEAKFMDVQEGSLDELGISWMVNSFSGKFNAGTGTVVRSLSGAFGVTGASGGGGQIVTPFGTVNVPLSPPATPGTADTGSAVANIASITGVMGNFDVAAQIRAIAQKQGSDLLSAPKVTVLSGNPAFMVVAQELRYPQSYGETESEVGTSSGNGGGAAGVTITPGTPEEFVTRNVGVELRVTPTVEDDNYSITLDLNPKVTEFEGFIEYGGSSVAISGNTTVTLPSGYYQPIFSTREVTTKVTVWDGATLVMGGLTREEVKRVNDKVPILGDIPFLGRLFKSKGESSQKRNLLVFVTANLVSPGGSPKKQPLQGVQPNSMFQNPTLVTPAGPEPRIRAK
ncbi:type II secretory pathway, component PulD [Opitutaceae bacterium TAV4]|nr:type II secretory pathway, component PulD [Opitutaceae bacterium TAV4]RRJ98665.1 type II secretory pathway, component PulD [Opitutaceae bacterium TAV3]